MTVIELDITPTIRSSTECRDARSRTASCAAKTIMPRTVEGVAHGLLPSKDMASALPTNVVHEEDKARNTMTGAMDPPEEKLDKANNSLHSGLDGVEHQDNAPTSPMTDQKLQILLRPTRHGPSGRRVESALGR